MARKRRNKPNFKRSNDKFDRKDSRGDERMERFNGGENDISWYSKYPNLLVAAGSFPYTNRPGMSVQLGPITVPSGTATGQASFTIPGVMALDWMPSLGKSNSATDPISICAKEWYAKTRAAFSGSLDVDAPDFVMYLGALDSVFAYIAWLKRLYRVMNTWTPENYALPDIVLCSMGLSTQDIESLRLNRTQLWQSINELVYQSRKFTCPALMDVFNRHYWMSDNVYTDAPEINSQFYLFNLKFLYHFKMLPTAQGDDGPGLEMIAMPTVHQYVEGSPLTVGDFYEFGRQLIDDLVAWDDAYIINGYLRRAFDGVPQFIVDELPQDQPFNPLYVEEVLTQIENSRSLVHGAVANATTVSQMNVTQDVLANCVISNPGIKLVTTPTDAMINACNVNPMLSIRSATPTVEMNTIASRLHCVSVLSNTTAPTVIEADCGTEVPLTWRLHDSVWKRNLPGWANTSQSLNETFPSVWSCVITLSGDGADTVATANQKFKNLLPVFKAEQFDWHPFAIIYYSSAPDTSGGTLIPCICGDTHNVTTVLPDSMNNLHKICLYSEFNAFSI